MQSHPNRVVVAFGPGPIPSPSNAPFTRRCFATTDSQTIAATIPQLLGGHHSVRLTSEGDRALCIETIGSSPDGTPLISLAHYGVQHGDVMADPEMTCALYTDASLAEPLTYRNDDVGRMQDVYEYSPRGNTSRVRPRLKKE